MSWGQVKVESVELVQDMSYEVILEKMKVCYGQAGMSRVYDEGIRNFRIALEAVERYNEDFQSFMLQCEDSYNILLGTLFSVLDITEIANKPFGGKKECILHILVWQTQGQTTERAIIRIIECCEREVTGSIKRLTLIPDKEKLEFSKQLSYCLGAGGKPSIFKAFGDNLIKLINIVDDKIKHHCGRSDKELLYSSVGTSIYSYADVMIGRNKSLTERALRQIFDTVWNTKEIVEHPFIYTANKILNN